MGVTVIVIIMMSILIIRIRMVKIQMILIVRNDGGIISAVMGITGMVMIKRRVTPTLIPFCLYSQRLMTYIN